MEGEGDKFNLLQAGNDVTLKLCTISSFFPLHQGRLNFYLENKHSPVVNPNFLAQPLRL